VKIGVNTFTWSASWDRTVLELFPVIRENGFDGVEVPLFRAQDFPAAELRKSMSHEEVRGGIAVGRRPVMKWIDHFHSTVEAPRLCVFAEQAATTLALRGGENHPIPVSKLCLVHPVPGTFDELH
jgi:hypothetical protein